MSDTKHIYLITTTIRIGSDRALTAEDREELRRNAQYATQAAYDEGLISGDAGYDEEIGDYFISVHPPVSTITLEEQS